MTGLVIAKPLAVAQAPLALSLHVAFGRSPMVAVAAGSVDLRKAHRVTGKQACSDVQKALQRFVC